MAAMDPIRDSKQIKQLAEYWLEKGNYRNYVMIILGVHTALRITDLLQLKWEDVYDGERGKFRSHIVLTENKWIYTTIPLLKSPVETSASRRTTETRCI